MGEFAGSETFALQASNLPENGAAPFSLRQPYQAINYLIGVNGDPVDVGTVSAFAGSTVPAGWLAADGGSGNTFNLPDLRGRTIIGAGAAPGLRSWSLGETSGADMAALIANNLPVPEPTSAALIFGSAALLLRRRRPANR